MRAIAYPHYRFYKDRFLLSLSVSILLHLVALFIFFHLPKDEKESTLRPISLGVLNSSQKQNIAKEMQSLESNTPSKSLNEPLPKTSVPLTQAHSTPQHQAKSIAKSTQNTISKPQDSIKEQTNIESSATPSSDIDLNALNIPKEEQKFDPLATKPPSLSQTLQDNANNAKLQNLPSRVQDELYKLYGTELDSMSKEQKDYLAESYFINAEVFQRTADRMGYPKLAAYLRQQGKGIIEFTLHPDGHIDGIKIVTSTGFEALDESMRLVVEQSAKSLKRPPRPISVRLGGHYRLTP